jgi:hypothetical protein
MNENMELSKRIERARAVGYKVLLQYVRLHTTGTFAGKTTTDTLPFCRVRDAEEWLSKVNEPKISKRNGYSIITHQMVTL